MSNRRCRSAPQTTVIPVLCAITALLASVAQAQEKPNIVIIWGDDIGQSNFSAYTRGMGGVPDSSS